METTGLKFRVARLFRSTLYSCRHECVLDTVQEPVFVSGNGVPLLPLPKDPFTLSVRWGCRSRRWSAVALSSPQSTASDEDTAIDSDDSDSVASFRKMLLRITSQSGDKIVRSNGSDERIGYSFSPVSESKSDEVGGCKSGKCCPEDEISGGATMKKKKKKSGRRRKKSNREINLLSASSSGTGWFSSEEDRGMVIAESEELFSSKSTVSSECSFETSRSQRSRATGKRAQKERERPVSHPNPSSPSAKCQRPANFPESENLIRDSVAVVKSSIDPYSDFKESMVEMILEKKMFEKEDLQQLLHCFLSLNSTHHHHVIIKVFTDIWDVLFCAA